MATYTAFQGNQLAKTILHDIGKALEAHPAFQAYIGHHEARYTVKIHMESYPYDAGRVHDIELAGAAATGPAPPAVAEALTKNDDGSPALVKGDVPEISREVVMPNAVRQEVGLPVEEMQEVSPGNFADLKAGETPFD